MRAIRRTCHATPAFSLSSILRARVYARIRHYFARFDALVAAMPIFHLFRCQRRLLYALFRVATLMEFVAATIAAAYGYMRRC